MLPAELFSLFLFLIWPQFTSAWWLAKRAPITKVISPHEGDSITTGVDLEIRWQTSATKGDVSILLRKGGAENLTTVHTIASSTPNNGSYYWRSNDDRFLRAVVYDKLPEAPTSACDYIILLRDRDDSSAAYSPYFTIINLNDDGLPKDANCPAKGEVPKIEGGSEGNGGSEGSDVGGNKEVESDGDAEGEQGMGSSNGDNGDGQVATSNNGYVTAAALAGAVVGTAAGVLLIFIGVFFLAKKRGWFVDKEYIRDQVREQVALAVEALKPFETKPPPEMVRNVYPSEINSKTLHQMPASPHER
ncbi:hypothetical protein AJ80_00328 [Polytolypa hystricis UAMH7299]|uniref:Yeast cell wall synthesis Kre9/Knh1-like N-terminal domain-containing protein n=1 Tax=Polytolypa hystricis (strain UAMH7299) TaxID=1447883 RepID=A0A2B7Z4V5_POLH7|nr:hypothetical protein AJ80_00328 [Polytolypa hystricis UAMH7299]